MNFSTAVEKILSNRKWLFWLGNSLFWTINFTVNSILILTNNISRYNFIPQIIVSFSGFIITVSYRHFFNKYKWHKFNLSLLIPLILIMSATGGLVWNHLFLWIIKAYQGDFSFPLIEPDKLITQVYYNSWPMLLWCVLYLGYKVWEEWNEQKLQIEKERALLKTSQLEMLKYQLNPHFLFNTLSSLRGLISPEPAKAKEMVTQISEFLRYSLLEGKNNEVQLIKEIEIVKLYLNIEQVRYNEDLEVIFNIAPETNELMIPIFLIHPLVENAVKHGMQTSQLPLKITIHSERTNNSLLLEITNTGKWIDKDNKSSGNGTGIGLENIKKRLEHSFPESHTFVIVKNTEFVKIIINIIFP